MKEILFMPPMAFLVYLGVAGLIFALGRLLAGPEEPTELKSSLYAGGEASPAGGSAPGYRPFFVIALFFAILHLGVLLLGSGELSWMAGAYLVGLILVLVALILG
jgi:NADH:ubiquinone oxidoreductase subunit 3 (subunit A)